MLHNAQLIDLSDYTLLNDETKNSDTNLTEIIVDSRLQTTRNSPHLNRELVADAKKAVASINAVLKLFKEYTCTSPFTLSSLTLLSSTIGWIGMGIAANRLDGAFFAAVTGGMAELLLLAIAILLILQRSFGSMLGAGGAGLLIAYSRLWP